MAHFNRVRAVLNLRNDYLVCVSVLTFVCACTQHPLWGDEGNLAENESRSGYPHPLDSDSGWGGGANPWEILDGLRSYPHWAHGLAFTGGRDNWVDPAGPRQVTIDFGIPQSFHKVVIWHHTSGSDPQDLPEELWLDYWDGESWVGIDFERSFDLDYHDPELYAVVPDVLSFPSVTGSKVRYRIDNRGNDVWGRPLRHGWIYEFEVFGPEVYRASFLRGDSDGTATLELTDAVFTLSWLFRGGDQPWCLDAADANDNGRIELTDAVLTLSFLFRGGPPLPAPFPSVGEDGTSDSLDCAQEVS